MRVGQVKGFLYLLIFNILVSAAVTLAVLYFWDQARLGERINPPTPAVIYVPVTGTPPTPDPAIALLLDIATSPASTETPTPVDFSNIRLEPYRVQPGDSLGLIAQRFEISVADLLAVNNLDDPDRLLVGQELLIPSGPLPTPTLFIPSATITPTPTRTPRLSPTPTLTPTRTPNQEEAVVRIESVLGVGDYLNERVKLVHISGRDITLLNWILADSQGNQFIFPQLTLRQGGMVYIHTRNGQNTVSDLYWGLAAALWQSGEIVLLKDPAGVEIARFPIPSG
jgi:LysM repeat protein